MLDSHGVLHWQNFLLFDLVDVGILVIDGDAILFANTTFSRIVGQTLHELQSKGLRELGGEAWVDFSLGQSWADALPWPMRDGTDRWFEVSMLPSDFEGRTVQIATCTDVTSRMRAEGAEATMLQMLTEIIEGYPVGTFVLDKDHQVTHWNRACEVISGTPASQVVGSDEAWRAFGMEERPLLADLVMKPINEAELQRYYKDRYWKSPAADGAYEAEVYFEELGGQRNCWLHVAATPLRNANGDIVGAIQTLLDVSKRVHIEQMLSETIGSAPVGIFVIDTEHRVTHWNKVCEIMSGMSSEQVVGGTDAWQGLYPEQRPVLADLIVNGITEEEILKHYPEGDLKPLEFVENAYQLEAFYPQVGANGAWLHLTAAPLRDVNGRVAGAIETLIDVTARKTAEEELRHAHQAAERLVTERTQELLQAKAALEEDIVRRKMVEEEMQRHLAEVTDLNTQLHETQSRLMQSQQQLVQNEKLASIGQLAAGVAHEINNPIGYVFSNFSSLQTYLDDLIRLINAFVDAENKICDDTVRMQLTKLRKEIDLDYLKNDLFDLMNESREGIERVRKIVQDLKDFSHVDANADWQWADLHRGLESTLNVVNNEIKYKADVIRTYGTLPFVQCLPSQLNQVFMNLLVNAAQAMPNDKRGTIEVSTGVEEGSIWVRISDNGCGMPEEVISRIFDPFFTTKPVGKGTGLGLSLSYGIIQKHHGSIKVDSEVGQGTTFTITLPVNQPIDTESPVP